ncbi:MAG: hypothetical protein APG12_01112 [Candidatus Methanofastidiosum methylothiophilum]|uniref:DUF8173 domain-containing protein n=1 Tax=Candidatus Methanofastidiosum methylothiophilum TaxID=1705564 RepID=A0A150IRI5_9EURY|nr:MAG: hypothetical protein APG10_01461 [Candidatus Methanofastidiosum methylthiophilus]KYC47465.1 MAG: hypothetical protein APG11_01156 [Candidatus Methanofastidiosum methylthiophilus]KYC50024.1 MAG: hypothetical protein APG12_01112 [Candidatus Methanofastidiosum methylthiophilus]
MMNMKKMMVVLLLLALLVPSVYAAQTVKDQNGKVINIQNDVNDDLFVSGDQVTINGNINGDLFAVGGQIVVNGNVTGDAYIAGGNVTVNGNITGGLILGAGQATISGNTGKILAACGDLAVKGKTDKIIAGAGNVKIYSTSVVNRYAYISTGVFENQGKINGELNLSAEQLIEKGSVGSFNFQQNTFSRDFSKGIKSMITVFSVLAAIGMLVLGILFIHLFPKLFFVIEKEVEKDIPLRTVVGFLLAIASVIAITIIAITVIGFPIAAILGMFLVVALMTSGLFVSYCTGKFVTKRLNINTTDVGIFIIGFLVLTVLKLIPVLGFFVGLVVVSLGFGAIFYTLKNNWNLITAKN